MTVRPVYLTLPALHLTVSGQHSHTKVKGTHFTCSAIARMVI